jgi:hypothetical protein
MDGAIAHKGHWHAVLRVLIACALLTCTRAQYHTTHADAKTNKASSEEIEDLSAYPHFDEFIQAMRARGGSSFEFEEALLLTIRRTAQLYNATGEVLHTLLSCHHAHA